MLNTGNNFGNNWLKYKELLERIIGNFKSMMYLSLSIRLYIRLVLSDRVTYIYP